jgi:hypothetical protein
MKTYNSTGIPRRSIRSFQNEEAPFRSKLLGEKYPPIKKNSPIIEAMKIPANPAII